MIDNYMETKDITPELINYCVHSRRIQVQNLINMWKKTIFLTNIWIRCFDFGMKIIVCKREGFLSIECIMVRKINTFLLILFYWIYLPMLYYSRQYMTSIYKLFSKQLFFKKIVISFAYKYFLFYFCYFLSYWTFQCEDQSCWSTISNASLRKFGYWKIWKNYYNIFNTKNML